MKISEKILSSAFLAIAILSMIFAICCFCLDNPMGGTVAREIYGGDAYTGMQNASATAASNVYYAGKTIAEIIKSIGGFFFIIVGLTFGSLSASKFIQFKEKTSNNSTGQAQITSLESNATENV